MDCSLPGSSVHGILQARVLDWIASPSLGDLPNPGIEPKSPTLQADSLPNEPQGSPNLNLLPLNSLSKGDAKVKNIYLSVSHAYFKVPSG